MRRLRQIEFIKIQAIVAAIFGAASSPPNSDNAVKVLNELESLMFPAVKRDRKKAIDFAREIMKTYEGKTFTAELVNKPRKR